MRSRASLLVFGLGLSLYGCSSGGSTLASSDSGTPPPVDGGGDSRPPGEGGIDSGGVDSGRPGEGGVEGGNPGHAIQTVFIILMENLNWSLVTADPNATYINNTLVKTYAHAEQYFNPPGNHPSEPNYIWLESGDNLGITTDDDPATNHQSTTSHLVTQLSTAGIPWKAYVEGIDGSSCPLMSMSTSPNLFACKHTPMLFFDDVTNTNSAMSQTCISRVRPYTELATDLSNNSVARYNFITPNLCDDMHNALGCTNFDPIQNGDQWLQAEVPKILASQAYLNGGVLFITWDEGTFSTSDGPIGMIVVSPLIKSAGYSNMIKYDHSSTLKTIEEVFGLPLLRHAADSTTTDLADFFTQFP